MASSSHCFFIVSMVLVSQFLAGSTLPFRLTSTTYIDKLCSQEYIDDKPFCLQTLSAYPPAVSAKALIPLAKAVILDIVQPQAKKAATFAAAQKDPTFKECHEAYVNIQGKLVSAARQLEKEPVSANYDALLCLDNIDIVEDVIGKKQDPASKTLMQMTMQMIKLIRLAVAATEVVGGLRPT